MVMKKEIIAVLSFVIQSAGGMYAQDDYGVVVQDTVSCTVTLDDILICSPKETGTLMSRPVAGTEVGGTELEDNHVTSLVEVANLVPNFFMPDYGSRLTSAIYIRGVGSRINTPAVGLYVDDIPYIDKSAFNFRLNDIDHVEVLRGPQSTLYGRNAMGGLVKVYTKDPSREVMPWQLAGRTDVKVGYATQDNHRDVTLSHYHSFNNGLAVMLGGYYEGSDGFFRHSLTGRKVDDLEAGGARLRGIYEPDSKLKLDLTASYDYSDEGGYPYYLSEDNRASVATASTVEPATDYIGKITSDFENRYRRGLFNAGLNIYWKPDGLLLHSATGFQNLNDRMCIDQDFTADDYYTLEQRQRLNVISEEITLRNDRSALDGVMGALSGGLRYDWLFGASAFCQWLHTDGPVTFHEDGIRKLIEGNVNAIFEDIKVKNPRMPEMGLKVDDNQFVAGSDMDTPLMSAGLFHQSTFSTGPWTLSAGIRMDYEKLRLDYDSRADLHFYMTGMMFKGFPTKLISPSFRGEMERDYVQWLPKLSLRYSFGSQTDALAHQDDFVYAAVSRGYRSGGYNVQMFSDLLQGQMRNMMIDDVDAYSNGMMSRFVDIDKVKSAIDLNSVIYEPEYSWNYELGAHVQTSRLSLQAALFRISTYDQQIARFATSGLGRMMVNAGESTSLGAELSASYRIKGLSLNANYGYTHATFDEYDDGRSDYSGNFVPFVPMHNGNIGAVYTLGYDKTDAARRVSIGADVTGQGRIYWTEANDTYQDFYAFLNAHVTVALSERLSVNLWGKNLTSSHFNTFYFESAGRLYEQHNKPFRLGVDVRISF